MANAAAKRVAAQNESAIRRLNIGMALVNLNWLLLRYFIHHRFPLSQILLYLLTLAPSLALYRYLLASGTPQRDSSGLLLSPGEDLSAGGVTEYAWDVIYVTWACALGSAVLGGWVWWFYLLIPGYALYKGSSFLLPLLSSLTGGLPSLTNAGTPGPAGAGGPGPGPGPGPGAGAPEGLEGQAESKRQQKLRKRMERGDPRIRQVERKRAA
ncbi:DUF788-domain-containing protein [Calocera viscosa TUFC12733]|uniref:DUF788-domain-containing protein n=1 Tax=Calocera viscosa (strain TUFC12733) TaxID=1330018 RepID=A0A167J6E4_CALVF|nr:DUF788-domain-containing protein [Calocera viscosa TUFC12733]